VPFAVGIENVLAGGQLTIEHLTGYIDPDGARFLIPEDRLDIFTARTREAGAWNVPTLSLYPRTVSHRNGWRNSSASPAGRSNTKIAIAFPEGTALSCSSLGRTINASWSSLVS
jgi:hypothetical protein